MGRRARGWHVVFAALLASSLTGPGWADDYCCICKGKNTGKSISAGDDLSAGAQCTISCRRPTLPRTGKCEAPPAPTAAPAAAAASGTVLLFASEDCSGDATKVTASTANVTAGMRSFAIDAGSGSVWQKADYGGARTQPVPAGVCISPGWEIGSVRF